MLGLGVQEKLGREMLHVACAGERDVECRYTPDTSTELAIIAAAASVGGILLTTLCILWWFKSSVMRDFRIWEFNRLKARYCPSKPVGLSVTEPVFIQNEGCSLPQYQICLIDCCKECALSWQANQAQLGCCCAATLHVDISEANGVHTLCTWHQVCCAQAFKILG